MRFVSIASGKQQTASTQGTGGEPRLIDAGISAKRIEQGLNEVA